MPRPLLIGFLGAPGSGKTAFAKQIAPKLRAVMYTADAMRMAVFGSQEAIERARIKQPNRVYRDMFAAMNYSAEASLKAGQSVIYDAQMTKRRSRRNMERLALKSGAKFVLVWIKTSPEVAFRRGQEREPDDDSHPYSLEKMTELTDRFAYTADLPGPDEAFIEIDGESSFEEQYRQFMTGLDNIE